jgi:hypothetical protein
MIAAPYRFRYVNRLLFALLSTTVALFIVMAALLYLAPVRLRTPDLFQIVPFLLLLGLIGCVVVYDVEVDQVGISLRPWSGILGRQFVWAQIVDARAARSGVRLYFADGRSSLVSANDPEGLLKAIERFRTGAA